MRSKALVVFVGALLGLAAIAEAAPKGSSASKKGEAKPDKAARERAAALFQEADANYKIKEYEKALAGFKEAYLLSQEPVLLFNIGQCHRQLGELEEALKSYEAFLRDDPKSPLRVNAEERIKEIKEELARRASRGAIEITTRQDPAEVYLDGALRGLSPLRLDEIPPGEHLLVVRKAGFLEYSLSIHVEPAQTFVLEVPQLAEEPEKKDRLANIFFLASGGTGAAMLASGGVAFVLARAAARAQEQGEDGIGERMQVVKGLANAANALLGVAAVSGAVGVTLKLRSRAAKKTEAVVSASPAGLSLTLGF